ncbi:putative bifunctional diguanylate cyclase/phosphodiesterase [Shewanella khirikhana]|uniref:putative bifunctional diguanylate cyclase/phosphodiesterase n=1 Tax=Shewanella khirikhana TaxID=1965282 RepID=UPI001F33AE31|nr:bifunctional diguanylate cyclase/phosphodiesterase [Shewanella khirikhana]
MKKGTKPDSYPLLTQVLPLLGDFAVTHELALALYHGDNCLLSLNHRNQASAARQLDPSARQPLSGGVSQQLCARGLEQQWRLELSADALPDAVLVQAQLLLEGIGVLCAGLGSGLMQSFLDAFDEHLWIKDGAGRYRFANRSTLESWGLGADELLGKGDEDIFPAKAADFCATDAQAIAAGHPIVVAECIDRDQHKGRIWLETLKAPMYDGEGRLLGVIGYTRDIARYKAAEEQLMLTSKVFENAAEGVMITNPDGIITDINGAFEKITGYQRDEVLGKTPRLLNSGRHEKDFFDNFWRSLKQQGHWHGEIWNRRKNGTLYAEQISISSVYGDDGQIRCYVAVFSDISLLKQTEAEVAQLAWHDPLTRLPNRSKLNTIMQQQLKMASHHKSRLALLLIDVDLFKHINDSFGHVIGDKVLYSLSERLGSLLDAEDTLARIGGDEFVVLTEVNCRSDITSTLEAIQRAFDTSFSTDERGAVRLSASIGIALYPEDGKDPDTLLKNADAAMYRAKQQGRNSHAFYTEQMTQSSLKQLKLQTALREAVRHGRFYLLYQPKVDLQSRAIVGLEALCRWTDPDLGSVSPADFIPVAEAIGLMPEIGLWVLAEACRQTKAWLDAGLSPGRVAVNVSGSQLAVPGFVDDVAAVLAKYALPGTALELEITESMVLLNPEGAIDTLEKLKAMGIRLALDDFGTGYSSLSYLRKLPIDTLKIDQSFVRELPADQDSAAIAMAIIAMGEALRLSVIAEGVETEEQANLLYKLGCTEAQGYLFARPQLAFDLASVLPPA